MHKNLLWFNRGGERTVKLKKQISGSLVLQLINKSIGFVLFPLYLTYVSKENLGIWLTILSVVSWFNLFDLGLGNGLKNKFAEAKATNQSLLLKKYISTTYACVGLISVALLLIFLGFFPFIPWGKIFNVVSSSQIKSLNALVLICFTSFFLQFALRLISTILDANQQPSFTRVITTISNVLILAGILLLTNINHPSSIVWLGLIYSGSTITVLISASIYFFSTNLKNVKPSLKHVDFKVAKPLMFLGIKFFILQISTMVIYSTDRFLITHFQSPSEVTVFDAGFRYFNLLFFPFRAIVSPFWPAITEAYAKKEYSWIKKGIKKIISLWGVFLLAGIVMLVFSGPFYKIWLNGKVVIPFSLSMTLVIEVLINALVTIFAVFASGVGKLGVELIVSLVMCLLNIPLSYLFGVTYKMGTEGIVLATIICSAIRLLFLFIQYKKVTKGKAKGIWNI